MIFTRALPIWYLLYLDIFLLFFSKYCLYFAANSWQGIDYYNCTYATRGNYIQTVTAESRLETKLCTNEVEILNPVEEKFTVDSDAPINYETDNTCKLNILMSLLLLC